MWSIPDGLVADVNHMEELIRSYPVRSINTINRGATNCNFCWGQNDCDLKVYITNIHAFEIYGVICPVVLLWMR